MVDHTIRGQLFHEIHGLPTYFTLRLSSCERHSWESTSLRRELHKFNTVKPLRSDTSKHEHHILSDEVWWGTTARALCRTLQWRGELSFVGGGDSLSVLRTVHQLQGQQQRVSGRRRRRAERKATKAGEGCVMDGRVGDDWVQR